MKDPLIRSQKLSNETVKSVYKINLPLKKIIIHTDNAKKMQKTILKLLHFTNFKHAHHVKKGEKIFTREKCS